MKGELLPDNLRSLGTVLPVDVSSQKESPCPTDAITEAPTDTLAVDLPPRALALPKALPAAPTAAMATATPPRASAVSTFRIQPRATPPRAPPAPTETSTTHAHTNQGSTSAWVSKDQTRDDMVNATSNELSRSNRDTGILCSKIFVLDGSFECGGGAEYVKSIIEGAGGKVNSNISKYTGKWHSTVVPLIAYQQTSDVVFVSLRRLSTQRTTAEEEARGGEQKVQKDQHHQLEQPATDSGGWCIN